MSKHYIFYFLLILTTILTISYAIFHDEFKTIESTDLSNENINGIYLMDIYDEATIREILGEYRQIVKQKEYDIYIYGTKKFYIDLFVDDNRNIVGIHAIGFSDNSIKTSKGININSTPDDVKEAYGDNFITKEYGNFMSSGSGYFLKFLDKQNKLEIQFDFSNDDKEQLIGIRFFKH